MTIKEALDDIVTSGINLGAGDFVDPEALEVAASVLEKMQWISVKDRQPNNKGCYLLTVKHWLDGEPVVREAYWNGKDWFSCDDRRYKITLRVTHWMPLPDAPKGVNDGSCERWTQEVE